MGTSMTNDMNNGGRDDRNTNVHKVSLDEASGFAQTVDNALGEVESILIKMKQYAERASDDSASDAERKYLQAEVNSLKKELDYLSGNAEYKGQKLFDGATVTIPL